MNVLFANYGDFATNSTSHIAGFANALADAGHACVFAVPWGADTVRLVPEVRFDPATFQGCLDNPARFPDGRPADVVHAWTPREIIREFVLRYCALSKARLIIHLEDNEDYLFSAATELPVHELLHADERLIREKLTAGLSHPRRARLLLRAADAITTIVPTLRAFAPEGVRVLDLPPSVDLSLFHPKERCATRRTALGIAADEQCIVYPGSTSYANASETRDLYEAVGILNRGGTPTRLIRTGVDDPAFAASVPERIRSYVLHLGFIPRTELPGLLAEGDVLVQPGRPGLFNNFRLPSKVPEFLACGRPVILPASNIGLELIDGTDAVVLGEATPETIAEACRRVFGDPAKALQLGTNAAAFARERFDGARLSRRLIGFYEEICAGPVLPYSASSISRGESEVALAMQHVAHHLKSPPGYAVSQDLVEILLPLVRNLDLPDGHQADLARVTRERDEWRQNFESARDHATNLARRNSELTMELDTLKVSHASELNCLREKLAQRDEKVERMTSSFSWRVTLPYRAIRRMFMQRVSSHYPLDTALARKSTEDPAEKQRG